MIWNSKGIKSQAKDGRVNEFNRVDGSNRGDGSNRRKNLNYEIVY